MIYNLNNETDDKKNLLLITLVALFAISCSNQGKTPKNENQTASVSNAEDANMTKVYYFHGKQRCKTCIAVQSLTQKIIKETYPQSEKIKFIEIDTSNKEFADLVEKYEVSWNALIVTKGDKTVDLTEEAFATAVSSPEVFAEKLKDEIIKITN